MRTDWKDFDEGRWHNHEQSMAEFAEMEDIPLYFTLDYMFKIAETLLLKHVGQYHFDVGWDWNFQAYSAHITTGKGKYFADADTPQHALLQALELWTEKEGLDI